MWYIILIFVFVAEFTISLISPYFINLTVSEFDTDAIETGISALDITSGSISNPLDAFVMLTTFQVEGYEILSIALVILHFMLFICLLKIAIDAINATGQWIPFT